jgi:hypothetical protein
VFHESTTIVHDHDNEEDSENNSVDDNSDLSLLYEGDVLKLWTFF